MDHIEYMIALRKKERNNVKLYRINQPVTLFGEIEESFYDDNPGYGSFSRSICPHEEKGEYFAAYFDKEQNIFKVYDDNMIDQTGIRYYHAADLLSSGYISVATDKDIDYINARKNYEKAKRKLDKCEEEFYYYQEIRFAKEKDPKLTEEEIADLDSLLNKLPELITACIATEVIMSQKQLAII